MLRALDFLFDRVVPVIVALGFLVLSVLVTQAQESTFAELWEYRISPLPRMSSPIAEAPLPKAAPKRQVKKENGEKRVSYRRKLLAKKQVEPERAAEVRSE